MSNKWVQHVKQFAKNNNISYACALTHPNIKDGYEKVIKKSKKEIREEQNKINILQLVEMFKNKIKNINNDYEKQLIKSKLEGYNEKVKNGLREKYPKYYNSLFD